MHTMITRPSGMRTPHMSWGREERGGVEGGKGRGGEGEGRGKGVRGQEGDGDGRKPFNCACVRGRIDCC